jgi:hypothetical protein
MHFSISATSVAKPTISGLTAPLLPANGRAGKGIAQRETGYTDKIKLTIAQMLVTITDSAMKSIEPEAIDRLPGIPLKKDDTFNFRCHKDLTCFNQCCRNLNLFLYPYDVLRLRKSLNMDSDRLLEAHVDVVLREGNLFPRCTVAHGRQRIPDLPFLSDAGCTYTRTGPTPAGPFPWSTACCLKTGPGIGNRQLFPAAGFLPGPA